MAALIPRAMARVLSRAPRRWRGGAMGTSRPTATGHECGARRGGTRGAHGGRTATRRVGAAGGCARAKYGLDFWSVFDTLPPFLILISLVPVFREE